MENSAITNKTVNVTALRFSGRGELRSVPKRIEFDNQQITFVDSGMHYLIKKGQELVRLFDMTDGRSLYRLRNDHNNWTLVRVRPMGV